MGGWKPPPLRFFAGKNQFLKISTCGFRLISSLDLLHASAKKFFRKIYSKGVPRGPKNFEKKNFAEACKRSKLEIRRKPHVDIFKNGFLPDKNKVGGMSHIPPMQDRVKTATPTVRQKSLI